MLKVKAVKNNCNSYIAIRECEQLVGYVSKTYIYMPFITSRDHITKILSSMKKQIIKHSSLLNLRSFSTMQNISAVLLRTLFL